MAQQRPIIPPSTAKPRLHTASRANQPASGPNPGTKPQPRAPPSAAKLALPPKAPTTKAKAKLTAKPTKPPLFEYGQPMAPKMQEQIKNHHLVQYNSKHLGIPAALSDSAGEKSPTPVLPIVALHANTTPLEPLWMQSLPSAVDLIKTKFGKPDENHSFTQEASGEKSCSSFSSRVTSPTKISCPSTPSLLTLAP